MSGWLRYLELQARAKTGLSSSVLVWAIVAAIAGATTFGLLVLAAFVWLADRYSPLTAALVLAGFFLIITLIALVACRLAQGRNVQQARVALAARSNAPWLDPKYLMVGMQVVRAVGWRRIVPLVAVAMLAAGLAREWAGKPDDDAGDAEEEKAEGGADERDAA
jgi:hypothetical protein